MTDRNYGPGLAEIRSTMPARAAQPGLRALAGAGLAASLLALAACGQASLPFGLSGGGSTGGDAGVKQASSVRLVDHDVEAPEVFQVSDTGLWDGRPSLGGVWVAFPDVKDPERVIIRNPGNGKFVIGALFRRERDMPGPKLQVSSDAAAALGMLAGAPAKLQVTALRRDEPVATDAAAPPVTAAPAAPTKGSTAAVTTGAAAAIARAEAKPAAPATPAAAPAPVATPAPVAPATSATASASALKRGYLQVGIFSVEANADRAAGQMKAAGLASKVAKEETQGKLSWRVLVGPFGDEAARDAAKAKVKGLGYPDAYAVSK